MALRHGARARTKAAAALAAVTAAGAVTLSGCASQTLKAQDETVATAGAGVAAALAAVQTSTCPATAPQALASNVGGLRTRLEPLDATKLLLCVYPPRTGDDGGSQSSSGAAGASGSSGASGASDSSSAAGPTAVTIDNVPVISSLQNALNALAAPPTEPVNCPNDTGAAVLGIFANGQQVTEVLMTTTGCPEATNGQKTGWVGASDFGAILSGALKG
jgi:hypothetical protein